MQKSEHQIIEYYQTGPPPMILGLDGHLAGVCLVPWGREAHLKVS